MGLFGCFRSPCIPSRDKRGKWGSRNRGVGIKIRADYRRFFFREVIGLGSRGFFQPAKSNARRVRGEGRAGLTGLDREGPAKMRFRWKYLETLGGILTFFGTLAILPGCPYFILFAYGPCDLSSSQGQTGLVVATAGAVLILVGEVARRRKSTPKPPLGEHTL